MNIEILNRANVPTPAAGTVYLFLDADNNNVLSYKDENCAFFLYSQGSSLNIANVGVDNCLCEIVSQLTCQFGKSVAKGIMTMPDFNDWWLNINIYRNFTIDPSTGSFTDSITTEPALLVTIASTDVLCNGDSTGTAVIGISGGSGPYVTVWGGGVNPAALAAGEHTVTVTDNNNKVVVKTIIIGEPAAIVIASATNPDTGGSVGTATANVTGGIAPYTYEWRDNGGTPIGQTTRTATGLLAATYQVHVTDANGCIESDLAVIVL